MTIITWTHIYRTITQTKIPIMRWFKKQKANQPVQKSRDELALRF